MATFFIILTGLFMAATLVTLGIGVIGMGKGGDFNKQNANRLMRLRVLFQGLAIASFLLFLVMR
ncbi:MAG TPA: twin transmembrane helix small protein [Alphaproteobacteria bacterium]|nr:twin transmembrane helix small protein [Alphaproteobacteria bacterium]